MSQQVRKITKATKVLENLREDITAGIFPAGEKLSMEMLKERYGVGYSPLREALSRLVSSGLVKIEEQCGFSVAPLSLAELNDLYKIRSYVETLVLQLAIENGDDEWEANVIASWHRFSKYLNPKFNNKIEQQGWERLQKEFLNVIATGCKSPWLMHIREILYVQSSRYRGLCIVNHSKNIKLMHDYIKQNQKLVNALLARDYAAALKISERNWAASTKAIAKYLKANLVK